MKGLSLGTGFSANSGGSATPIADWSAWDGTSDGTVKQLFTSAGLIGGQDIAAASATEAVLLYQDATTSPSPMKAVVLDRNTSTNQFAAETTNTAITLTGGNDGTGNNIVRMNSAGTRFVTLFEDTSGGSTGVVTLIGKSGKTLSELDVETTLGLTTPNFRCTLARLNDTQAVALIRDDGDSNEGYLLIIDITSDNITIGTAVDTGLDITDYPGIARATDSSFFFAIPALSGQGGGVVGYATVSGTTITVQGTASINGSTQYDDMMCERIDDTTCVVTYETVTGSTVDAVAARWTGSAVAFGTPVTDIFDGNDIFQATGTSTELGNRKAMFAGTMNDETPSIGAAVVLSVNESYVVTVGTRIQVSSSPTTLAIDHNTIDAVPGYDDTTEALYVFYAAQNEDTTPAQQVDTRIMVGF